MLLHLTDLSDESLQNQIARQIREHILAGTLAPHAGLPSIRALARRHRVSVITVQRAYEHLMRDDLIHSRRGKGFFVSDLPPEAKNAMARQRLREQISRPVQSASREGLARDEILELVAAILGETGKL